MNDKELLELAARAAGITLVIDPHGKYRNATGAHDATNVFSLPLWNPLRDPGDALRLAVALELVIDTRCKGLNAQQKSEWPISVGADNYGWVHEVSYDDPLAATCRAIVRAAAEIGRTKP